MIFFFLGLFGAARTLLLTSDELDAGVADDEGGVDEDPGGDVEADAFVRVESVDLAGDEEEDAAVDEPASRVVEAIADSIPRSCSRSSKMSDVWSTTAELDLPLLDRSIGGYWRGVNLNARMAR